MTVPITDLYALKPRTIWKAFASDNFAFWMSCMYLFFEYVRPQAIWPWFDAYPYWARTFVILAFIGWLLDPKKQFVWNRITSGVFVFLILIILSSQYAYWPDISWSGFMEIFSWVIIIIVLTQTITTRQRYFILLLIFLIASLKLSFYGARTSAMRGFAFADWGLAGPRGYFQNPGELAVQMVVFAPVALYFTLGIKAYLKYWQVYLLHLMPITAAITILGTNTRGSQIALAGQILALILTTKRRIKMFLAIAMIGIIGFQILPQEQKDRFFEAGDDETSIQRILYWKHGWQMMKDHPFLGVGYYNFMPYYTRHHSDDLILPSLVMAQVPHNIFIQVGTDTGFTGLAVFLCLIVASFASMYKLGREAEMTGDVFVSNMTKGMNLSLFGYLIAGQFVTIAYYPYFWIHLVFVSAMCVFKKNERNSKQ